MLNDFFKKFVFIKLSSKQRYWLLFLSTSLTIAAIIVGMLKMFYPYHRLVAVGLFISSFIPEIIAFGSRIEGAIKHPYRSIAFRIALIIAGCWVIFSLFPADNFSYLISDKVELAKKLDREIIIASNYIPALKNAESKFIKEISGLDLTTASPEKRNKIREAWGEYVRYGKALDQINQDNKYFYQINVLTDSDLHQESFVLAYSSYITWYVSALHIVEAVKKVPLVKTLLDEPNESLGIDKNSYSILAADLSDPANITQTNAGYAYLLTISNDSLSPLKKLAMKTYDEKLEYFGKSTDLKTTGALDYFEKHTFKQWFPAQKRVSIFMGDTRITLRNKNFITPETIDNILPVLEPGDVSIQRRNWYLSNAGLPGFWKHTAMHIGKLSELDEYFKEVVSDTDITNNMKVSEYLAYKYPEAYKEFSDQKSRTIEAESEGIVSLLARESYAADYVAFIRPNVSKEEKLRAILYSFEQLGKPYDFNFDFLTDNELVCSELYYKAYPQLGYALHAVSGRLVLSSNDIVKAFDNDNSKIEFIMFLDVNEKTGEVTSEDQTTFRNSWKRGNSEIKELGLK